MKRFLVVLLLLSLCVCLCACGKSAAAKNVDEQILAIGGVVTLKSKTAIDNAVNCYNALTEEEKTEVENYHILKQAQVSYLDALISSIENISLQDSETLLQAREYYDSLTPEQKEMASFQVRLEKIENDFARLEAFEELKELIRTKGTAVKEGGVNNSDEIVKWSYGSFELSKQGNIFYTVRIDIKDPFLVGNTYCIPATWITLAVKDDQFDVSFRSLIEIVTSLNDIDLAAGSMNDIMYESYSLEGELPDIIGFSSDTIAMAKYNVPLYPDVTYGEYIRGCIHDQIYTILTVLKNELGYDITKLGFSEDIVKAID